MKILIAGAEGVPFSSSGGLGDVIGSLPAAIKKSMGKDDDVRVILPLHKVTKEKFLDKMNFVKDIRVQLSWRNLYCGIYELLHNGVRYYFIDNEYYFKRKELYGEYDDAERYAFYCKAVLETMRAVDYFPDLLHANDWHTALSVVYLKCVYYKYPEYKNMKALYTIHNVDYQGIYGFDILDDVLDLGGIDRKVLEYDGNINLTKAAIVCADKVSTVSERYSRELLYEYFSKSLYHIMQRYSYKLCGIVNGIDTEYYCPSKDRTIFKKFDSRRLKGKRECKEEFQKEYGLEVNDRIPVVAVISRLASHKGLDLIKRVFDEMVGLNIQFVLLGKGEKEYEDFFREVMNRNLPNVRIILDYDKELSKRIYAAADIFLMPSKSEPCGLAQMIASRYGAVPLVHEVGGLSDTIKPYNPEDEETNGFSFKNYNAHDMLNTLKFALSVYDRPLEWKKLMKVCMKKDFSWDKSAAKYMELYEGIIEE